jgi:hypothetical protein
MDNANLTMDKIIELCKSIPDPHDIIERIYCSQDTFDSLSKNFVELARSYMSAGISIIISNGLQYKRLLMIMQDGTGEYIDL